MPAPAATPPAAVYPLRGGGRGIAILNLTSLGDIAGGAILEDRNRRRRGAISSEVAARTRGGLLIEPGESRRDDVGPGRVSQRERDPRPGFACGASADRVDDHHQCSCGAGDGGVDVLRGP